MRDRAAAVATFTFIGLFTIGSVDAIVTGGADFGPSAAYAMSYEPARATPIRADAPVAPQEAPAAIKAAPEQSIDYSFTTETLLGGPEELAPDEITLLLDEAMAILTATDAASPRAASAVK